VNEFHPTEQVNPVPMEPGCDGYVPRRAAIKLSTGPKIVVCIPIGGKGVSTVLECPQCVERGEPRTRMEVDEGFQPQGLVHINFMLQQMNWLPPLNVTIAYMFKTGMLSGAARNMMTLETLRSNTVEYIFYVDDDMMIPAMGLYTLYNLMEQNPGWGAVTGVYSTRQDPPEPLVYTAHGQGANWDFEMGPGASPTKIMGAGAGCLLARVSAIRSWMDANPGTAIWADATEARPDGNRVTWGHDVRFVRNLTEAGWPCYVDGRVLCDHYDRFSGKTYRVPESAPGFKKRNVNTETYWDAVYSREGFDSWRTYEAMYSSVVEALAGRNVDRVVELGCGPGVLGQRITASIPCSWVGMDMSAVAVAQAKARYLNAVIRDVRELSSLELDELTTGTRNAIVATELAEHLDQEALARLLSVINSSGVEVVVLTTPWKCMGPEEVPEHTVLVDEQWVESAQLMLPNYELVSCGQVDDAHAIHVWVLNKE